MTPRWVPVATGALQASALWYPFLTAARPHLAHPLEVAAWPALALAAGSVLPPGRRLAALKLLLGLGALFLAVPGSTVHTVATVLAHPRPAAALSAWRQGVATLALLGALLAAVTALVRTFHPERGCDAQAGALAVGVTLLACLHTWVGTAVTGSLTLFLATGLLGMAWARGQAAGSGGRRMRLAAWSWALAVPALAQAAPPLPGHGLGTPLSLPNTPTATGLGIGATNINHPVTVVDRPVYSIAGIPGPGLWAVATYSQFNGVRWSNPPRPPVPFVSGARLPSGRTWPPAPLQWVTITVTALGPTPSPDIPYRGRPWRVAAPGSPRGLAWPDQGHWRWVSPAPASYLETIAIPEPRPDAWARAPYLTPPPGLKADLELPANLSPAVVALAHRVAGSAGGPWQAVEALAAYLDRHGRYTLDFSPSRHGNAVNRFLLVTHAGYCDQFSSSLVMMARALGIPARWVVGYGPGTFDAATDTELLTTADAHSWAEVWIAGRGWVAVDPTPAVPTTAAAPAATQTPGAGGAPKSPLAPPSSRLVRTPSPVSPRTARRPWLGPMALAAGALAGALWAASWRRTRHDLAHRLLRLERQLKGGGHRAVTLREQWAAVPDLAPAVAVVEAWRWGGILPDPGQLAQAEAAAARLSRSRWRFWQTRSLGRHAYGGDADGGEGAV
ncbi:MAG: transglutaminase-like domain-containing protein [Firmicutes bacterium]|nr:transglutaminase domain-containing protein [Alicyclobacillaceae bacterium]MCL6497828.1 transglutaminase-like domain-containing protein [Bacillota bacterium]